MTTFDAQALKVIERVTSMVKKIVLNKERHKIIAKHGANHPK